MTALNADCVTPRRDGFQYPRQVAANEVIFVGALVCLSVTGYLVPASADITLKADGVAIEPANNTGGLDGAMMVTVEKRPSRLSNSLNADLITIANIGANCYVVDDATVGLTNGGGTRPIAGLIAGVDSDGVWVKFQ